MARLAPAVGALLLTALGCAYPETSRPASPDRQADATIDGYIERYFDFYPTRAIEAGRQEFASRLEDFSPARLAAWISFNEETLETIGELDGNVGPEESFDLELIARRARLEIHSLSTREVHRADPLFWTRPIGNATVFLLVREDPPLADRLAGAVARAEQLPKLADQALAALADAEGRASAEVAAIAARQARASALFYREGFPEAGEGVDVALRERLAETGPHAAVALTRLADRLDALADAATGSPRLGEHYELRFRIVTGGASSPEVLGEAIKALEAKVVEAAAYGREVWSEALVNEPQPAEDRDLLRRLFARVSEDRASTVEEFVADYEQLLAQSVAFVRERDLITLPEPLTVHTARSPDFFVGQSVGGVYPAGPYAPDDADTLFYLPTPSPGMSAEQRDGFFRDFNHHFNVMITPHEMVPGHYLQLKFAARHRRPARALFSDGIYVEGWGTFCERLMLDLGWGGPLDRLAHLKKQLENIARTIVDIRVHTEDMSREEVLAFVRDQALQDEQFASNMWVRALTSSPQLVSYHLGYREVKGLYDDVKAARGDDFVLKEFMDGMMEFGPVPVRHYRAHMLGRAAEGGETAAR